MLRVEVVGVVLLFVERIFVCHVFIAGHARVWDMIAIWRVAAW